MLVLLEIVSKIEKRNSDDDTLSVVELLPKCIKKPPRNGNSSFFFVWVEIFVLSVYE